MITNLHQKSVINFMIPRLVQSGFHWISRETVVKPRVKNVRGVRVPLGPVHTRSQPRETSLDEPSHERSRRKHAHEIYPSITRIKPLECCAATRLWILLSSSEHDRGNAGKYFRRLNQVRFHKKSNAPLPTSPIDS